MTETHEYLDETVRGRMKFGIATSAIKAMTARMAKRNAGLGLFSFDALITQCRSLLFDLKYRQIRPLYEFSFSAAVMPSDAELQGCELSKVQWFVVARGWKNVAPSEADVFGSG